MSLPVTGGLELDDFKIQPKPFYDFVCASTYVCMYAHPTQPWTVWWKAKRKPCIGVTKTSLLTSSTQLAWEEKVTLLLSVVNFTHTLPSDASILWLMWREIVRSSRISWDCSNGNGGLHRNDRVPLYFEFLWEISLAFILYWESNCKCDFSVWRKVWRKELAKAGNLTHLTFWDSPACRTGGYLHFGNCLFGWE